ncbi:MAG TPA: SIMPL domain-containing protein [Bdellovibrionales bacterium]|nr:SIMPL domain-containing protein [Bdellovibrionales bacterium]
MVTSKVFAPLALCLALIPGLAGQAHAQDKITVTGTGIVKYEPNMAVVEGAVYTEAKTVKEAQQANARIFNAAVDALKTKFRLTDKMLSTAGYSVSPLYDVRPNGQRVLRGYGVRHVLKVVVANLADLGSIVDEMGAAGVNQLDLIRFSHSEKKKLQLEALALAMADAKEKADVIAASVGRSVQKVSNVSYHSSDSPEAVVRGEALAEKADATEFIPGELTISASVSAEYVF